jgi:hypothetical protein
MRQGGTDWKSINQPQLQKIIFSFLCCSVPVFVIASVADPDPVSGPFLTPVSGIRDPGWVKNQDTDLGSGSGMSNPDPISESLEAIFWVKILKFFYADPGSGMENIRIRDGKNSDTGSGINIPDPQHWL